MTRIRTALGLVAGILMILSSAVHSLVGWSQLRADLEKSNVPPDLVFGLRAGWQFAGLAMLVFGVLLVHAFGRRLRGLDAPSVPLAAIGGAYLAIGLWALVASGFDPFFLVFIVPGALVAVAAPAPR